MDYLIENGVLIKIIDPEPSVIIPDSVRSIGSLAVTVKRLNPKKHPAVYTAGTNQYTPSRTSSQALVIILLNSAESTS